MEINVITEKDLEIFKQVFLEELKSKIVEDLKQHLSQVHTKFLQDQRRRKFLKSNQVEKMLGISPGTVQNLRTNGTLPFSKVGGTIIFDEDEIIKIIEENKIYFDNLHEKR
jgi:predicted DNA-binding transcriptional regulator AlpA